MNINVSIKFRKTKKKPKLSQGEFKIMYIVKDSQEPVAFQITSPVITDAKGFPEPTDGLSFLVVSSNPNAVAVAQDPTDQTKGTLTFGNPNKDGSPSLANINVTVTDKSGKMIGSFGEQFTVTVGDAAQVSGGGISFAGLTAEPVVQAAPVVEPAPVSTEPAPAPTTTVTETTPVPGDPTPGAAPTFGGVGQLPE